LRPNKFPDYQALVARRREALRQELPALVESGGVFTLEIGSGHGHYLAAYAAAHPAELCIGVDLSPERVARAVRKQVRARLANLHFLLADADDFLASLPADRRIASILVLFPDPWPKRRHHKNRLIRPSFLTAVASFARPGTPFYFRTDHEPYFTEARAEFASHSDWEISADSALPFEEATVFEKRAPQHFTLVARRR